MRIFEAELDDTLLDVLVRMSEDWEIENSTYGYRKNGREDILGNRIFLAEIDGETVGYLFGKLEYAQRHSSIMTDGTAYFEVEELYVIPEFRGKGVGNALFSFAEATVRAEGTEYLMLSTATKDYRRILHFYIDELGMDFWSARLFKRI